MRRSSPGEPLQARDLRGSDSDAPAVPNESPSDGAIRVTVRFGSTLSPISGQARLSLRLSFGSTARDVVRLAARLHPDLVDALRSALMIVDGEQVDQTRPLRDGDEIALVMPVAGG
jgi:molybdopterin synthase sulfur carrier subunit